MSILLTVETSHRPPKNCEQPWLPEPFCQVDYLHIPAHPKYGIATERAIWEEGHPILNLSVRRSRRP
jgi:hypothetical protein